MKKISIIFLYIITLGLIAKAIPAEIIDPDIWWYLANAKYMFDHSTFLRSDVFSHTLYGHEWVNLEWLSTVIYYKLFCLGGLKAISYFKIFLLTSSIALTMAAAGSIGIRPLWIIVAAWLEYSCLILRPFERAETFTLLFLPLLILLIFKARQNSYLRKFMPYMLFIFSAIWANIHIGYFYAIGILIMFYIGARLNKEDSSYCRCLILSAILMCCAVLINPYGHKILLPVIDTFINLGKIKDLILEYKPTLTLKPNTSLMLSCFGLIFLIYGFIKKLQNILFWAPAVFIFSIWSMQYIRNTVISSFILILFCVWFITTFNSEKFIRISGLTLIAALIALSLPDICAQSNAGTFSERYYPSKACQFIRKNNIQGNMYNTYVYGGYIAWELGPERKIFYDGRYIFLDLLIQMYDLLHLKKGSKPVNDIQKEIDTIGDFFNSFDITYAIVDYKEGTPYIEKTISPFSFSSYNFMFPRSSWALVFWDDAALIFLKRVPSNMSVINKYEYKYLWPYNKEQMVSLLLRGELSKEKAINELARHQANFGATRKAEEIRTLIDKYSQTQ